MIAQINTFNIKLDSLDDDIASLGNLETLNGDIDSLTASLGVTSDLSDIQTALTGVSGELTTIESSKTTS